MLQHFVQGSDLFIKCSLNFSEISENFLIANQLFPSPPLQSDGVK